ncbi:transcription cofactor HES-6 [Crocuta crocuta]
MGIKLREPDGDLRFRSFPNPDPSTFPGPETAALTVALPFTVQHADAPLRRRLARSKTSVNARTSSCSHAQQTWGPCSEREQLQAEASERFAAGYIQCMHEVHTFVSTCQAIDTTVAAELLNHLLESMPLREGSSFRDLLGDALAGSPGAPGRSGWPTGGVQGSPLPSPPGPGDDLCSDLEEAPEAELTRAPAEGPDLVPAALGSLTAARIAQSVWRPW